VAAIASRYARAFAEVVLNLRLEPRQALRELNEVAALLQSNEELRTVLGNPAVKHEQKLALLDAIVSRLGGSRSLRNFVAVLIDHRRIGQIQDIARQFRYELNQRLGIAEAQVSSARELTTEERQALEKQIAAITGKQVQATYLRDAGLLGGAVVRVGSTIYDGSVRGQLRRIKKDLVIG
jgi:F-type H+-transporting ATPase subunit delta